MPKAPVKRSKRSVTLDILEIERRLRAGTLDEADRATAERMLPGLIEKLQSRAEAGLDEKGRP